MNSPEETQILLIRQSKCFAPAKIQTDASALIFSVNTNKGASVPLKIRALRSFQTSQHTRMTRDFKPLRETPLVAAISDHHSWTEFVHFQFIGCSDGSPSQKDKTTQIRLVNLHSTKRWFPVSRHLRQSEHVVLCGQPLARNLSAVQILSWTTSQLNNLHFGGAHADLMVRLKLVLIAPRSIPSVKSS